LNTIFDDGKPRADTYPTSKAEPIPHQQSEGSMMFRLTTTALLLVISTFAFADNEYTSKSPYFERHKELLANYLGYGGSHQACTTFAVGAGSSIAWPNVEELIKNGKVDMKPFMERVRMSLRPPDPFMNTLFTAIYLTASNPSFVEKYRLYQEEYETPGERRDVAIVKFLANCKSRSDREDLRDLIIEGYNRAAQL
jgi:hypothetical protein